MNTLYDDMLENWNNVNMLSYVLAATRDHKTIFWKLS